MGCRCGSGTAKEGHGEVDVRRRLNGDGFDEAEASFMFEIFSSEILLFHSTSDNGARIVGHCQLDQIEGAFDESYELDHSGRFGSEKYR